ncbi:MAG: hypothetical protein GX896_05140 [Clostridiales bacterium]|nr:hypothetical protein [Clostridiales bacterium]
MKNSKQRRKAKPSKKTEQQTQTEKAEYIRLIKTLVKAFVFRIGEEFIKTTKGECGL